MPESDEKQQPTPFELKEQDIAAVREHPELLGNVSRLFNTVKINEPLLDSKFSNLDAFFPSLPVTDEAMDDYLANQYTAAAADHKKSCFDEKGHFSEWLSPSIPEPHRESFKKFFNDFILQVDAEIYDKAESKFPSWIRHQLGKANDGKNLLDKLIAIHGQDALRAAIRDTLIMSMISRLLVRNQESISFLFNMLLPKTVSRTSAIAYNLCVQVETLKRNAAINGASQDVAKLLTKGEAKIKELFNNPCQDPGEVLNLITLENARFELRQQINSLSESSLKKKLLNQELNTISNLFMIRKMIEAIQLLREFEVLLESNSSPFYSDSDGIPAHIKKQYDKLEENISSVENISSFITELKPFNALLTTLHKQKQLLAPEHQESKESKKDIVNTACQTIYETGVAFVHHRLEEGDNIVNLQEILDTSLKEMEKLLAYQEALEENKYHAKKDLLIAKCDKLVIIYKDNNYKTSSFHLEFIELLTESTRLVNELNILSELIKDKAEYKEYYDNQSVNIYHQIASNDVNSIKTISLRSHLNAIRTFEEYKAKVYASTNLISIEQAATLCRDKSNTLSTILEATNNSATAFIDSSTIPMNLIDALNELKNELDKTEPNSLAFTAGTVIYEGSKKTVQDLFKKIPFDEQKAEDITKYLRDANNALQGKGNIQALLEDANNVPGAPNIAKQIIGGLIILAGLTVIGLGLASMPWTAGASAPLALYIGNTLITAGCLFATGAAVTAVGITIFQKGTQRGLSKGLHDLTKLPPTTNKPTNKQGNS